jgi:hypothetical protein
MPLQTMGHAELITAALLTSAIGIAACSHARLCAKRGAQAGLRRVSLMLPIKKEGRQFSGPKVGVRHDAPPGDERCSHSKAVKRWVRCDLRHMHRQPIERSAEYCGPLCADDYATTTTKR